MHKTWCIVAKYSGAYASMICKNDIAFTHNKQKALHFSKRALAYYAIRGHKNELDCELKELAFTPAKIIKPWWKRLLGL